MLTYRTINLGLQPLSFRNPTSISKQSVCRPCNTVTLRTAFLFTGHVMRTFINARGPHYSAHLI